jgi:hypothetical protein
MTAAADELPVTDLMWTVALFLVLLTYCWLVVTVLEDLFRRRDLSRRATTGWVVFVLVVPMIGSLTYLVSRGRVRSEHDARGAHHLEPPAAADVRAATAPRGQGDDAILRAEGLRDRGVITQQEYEQLERHTGA